MSTPRFRSTAALSVRQRRTAPHVDRATFVVFTLGAHRLAAPVESVERVLRPPARPVAQSPDAQGIDTRDRGASTVGYSGRAVPVLSLETGLCLPASGASSAARRTLILQVHDVLVAAEVDAVLEVVTIDVAAVEGIDEAGAALTGARGRFVRHGHEVIILDVLRVVRAVYVVTQQVTEPA